MKHTLKELKQQSEGLVHISEWLNRIGEHDQDCRAEVLAQCKDDPEARAYYVGLSAMVKEN